MANKAAQFRNITQAQYPGASVVGRERKSIRHQHPSDPSKFIIDDNISPIHYGATMDQEIDTAWQASGGAWDYEMTTNAHQAFARDTFNVGDIFRFEKNGEWVQFDPQSINWNDENYSQQQIAIKQNVTATVSDAILAFDNAYGTGIHFEYINTSAGLKKIITIDNPTDLPAVTLQGNTIHFVAEFSLSISSGLDVYLDDVLWTRQNGVRVKTANRVEFRLNSTGEVYWWLDFARAWDNGGVNVSETFGELEVRRQGGPSSLFVTVRIPKDWIDTAVFPIYIDPTIDTSITDGDDDAHEKGNNASFDGTGTLARAVSHTNINNAFYAGLRFDGVGAISSGDTIDVCYVTITAFADTADDMNCNLHFEDVDSAVNFSACADVVDRVTTTASAPWIADGLGASAVSSSSLVGPAQEVTDRAGFGGVYMVLFRPNTDVTKNFYILTFENGSDEAALHVEYTTSGSAPVLAARRLMSGTGR